jgi:hypothetical protein
MNAIECAARPKLTALIRGERQELNATDVETIATWTVKTSLMVQLTGTSTAALDDVYKNFFRDQRPPVNAAVWAAAVNGEDWTLRSETMSVLVATDGEGITIQDPPNTLAVTLGLGALLLHSIITARASISYPPHHEITNGVMVRFWPHPSTTAWPPSRSLNDTEAWFISRSLDWWLS